MYLFNNALLFKLQLKFPFLSKFINFSDGYIPDKKDNRDFWMGADNIDKQILTDNGQWSAYLPKDEIQRARYVETMGCTGYALLNCVEMLALKKWEQEWNKSDRFTNKMSGTSSRGNSMRNVLESVRKNHGMVNEGTWSWDETFTWNKYYAGIPTNIKRIGLDFLKDYVVEYERVPVNKNLMISALRFSPLFVAGFAWYKRGNTYRSYGRANHAFCIIGYVPNSHWIALDSYSPHIKHLDWNFLFGGAYLVKLAKKKTEFKQNEIDRLINKGYKYIMRVEKQHGAKGEIYQLSKTGLVELTAQDKIEKAFKEMAKKKDLTGISEKDYYNLKK